MNDNDNWLALGCALLAIILALVGILLPEQTSMSTYPYGNLTGVPSTFPYGNLTNIPQTFPYANLTDVPIVYNLTDGLVLWMPLNDGIGDASDYSGFMNHGTIYGASWVNGKYGKALSFDGTNDYAEVLHNVSLDLTTTLSFTAWINNSVGGTNQHDILCRNYFPDKIPYKFYILNNRLYFSSYEAGVWTEHFSTLTVLNDLLVFVAVTFDGSTLYFYVNDLVDDSQAWSFTLPVSIATLRVGSGYSGQDMFFKGIIDEVRIYNRALTQTEITLLYNLP